MVGRSRSCFPAVLGLALALDAAPAAAGPEAIERLGDVVRIHPQAAQPAPASGSAATQAIAGPSDVTVYQRITDTTQFPYSSLGYLDITLLNGQPRRCTGTVVAARTVLTAASCLKPGSEASGALAAQIRFTPGQTQPADGAPLTQAYAASTYWYYEMPTIFYDQADSNPDYAAVFFQNPVTSLTGFLGVGFDVVPSATTVLGYATTAAGDAASQALWRADAAPTGLAPRRLTLPVGYDQGLSGAPVIETTGSGFGRIVGIAVDGDTASLSATRLLAADQGLVNRWLGLAVPPQPLETGWWWSPAESGRGYFIEVTNGKLFMAVLGYADDGAPTWRVASGTMQSATHFDGPLLAYNGGAPIAASFRPPLSAAGVGQIAVDFTDSADAQLTTPWGVRQIQRFSFVPDGAIGGSPGAPYPQNGFWWNPGEPGIGVLVEVQGSTMMMATLDYDATGQASWAYATNAMVVPLLFAAPSAIVLGGPPDSAAWHPVAGVTTGQLFVLEVKATDSMVMSLANGSLRIPLSRFQF